MKIETFSMDLKTESITKMEEAINDSMKDKEIIDIKQNLTKYEDKLILFITVLYK